MSIREKELVLAKKCSYSMNCHETQLNNNVIIVGSSGCGKMCLRDNFVSEITGLSFFVIVEHLKGVTNHD